MMKTISGVEIVEFNEEKAYNWFIENSEYAEGVTVEDLVEEDAFFDNLQSVFEWIYTDEQSNVDEMEEMIQYLTTIPVEKIVESGANNLSEYLALQWENLHITPYGFIRWYV